MAEKQKAFHRSRKIIVANGIKMVVATISICCAYALYSHIYHHFFTGAINGSFFAPLVWLGIVGTFYAIMSEAHGNSIHDAALRDWKDMPYKVHFLIISCTFGFFILVKKWQMLYHYSSVHSKKMWRKIYLAISI